MAGVGLPNATVLATLDSLAKVREFARCPEATWNAVSTALGTVPDLILLAMLPASTLKATMTALRIGTGTTERPLSAMETIQVALMWRVARQAMNLPDVDPLQDPIAVGPQQLGQAQKSSSTKKVKSSAVLDQMDDTEIDLMTRQEIDQAHLWHIDMTGAEPAEEAEPTPEQLAALRDRVVTRREAPYADFSILTPHGRTMQRQMKARSWVLQQDGTFKSLDVPGPPTFESWKACWKVFRSILFMLRYPSTGSGVPPLKVVTAACLEEYFERIAKLNAEFPETWHLIMRAEDKCRAEMFERYRRQLTKASGENRLPMNLDYNPLQPWVGVFTFAARNKDYWEEQVTRPATIFIARGGKHMGVERAEKTHMSDAALQALGNAAGEPKEERKKKKKLKKGNQEDAESPKRAKTSGDKWEKEDARPKKWGKHFVSTEDGTAICFRYAKGKGGECAEPCKDGRAHVCQLCLGNHVNSFCPLKKGGKDAGKGKKANN